MPKFKLACRLGNGQSLSVRESWCNPVDYFLVHNAATFTELIHPALTRCIRQRSFEPCRDLCRQILPDALSYAQRYHTGSPTSLVQQWGEGRKPAVPFDRTLWRQLVGEVLLFCAVDIPEFQTAPDTWCRLLAPDQYLAGNAGVDPAESGAYLGCRENFAPIQQALWGSRDLGFGPAIYRPDQAGLNLAPDIDRLARELDPVDPRQWTEADLIGLRGISEADYAEELAFAREWFPVLCDQYLRARTDRRLIVHERIY